MVIQQPPSLPGSPPQQKEELERGPAPSSIRERAQVAETKQEGRASWGSDTGTHVALYDLVDGSWGAPQDSSTAFFQQLLRKVVFKCSACTEASAFEGYIAKHIQRVQNAYESHRDAEAINHLEAGRGPMHVCSGCGGEFSMRKRQIEHHLERIRHDGPSHRDAHEVTTLRFSLEAPAPRAEPPRHMGSLFVSGPSIGAEVVRSQRRDRRRRKRRRRR